MRAWPSLRGGLLVVLAFGLAASRARRARTSRRCCAGPTDASGEYRVDVARGDAPPGRARPLLGWGLGAYADAFPA